MHDQQVGVKSNPFVNSIQTKTVISLEQLKFLSKEIIKNQNFLTKISGYINPV
jgi:hypothetical protein